MKVFMGYSSNNQPVRNMSHVCTAKGIISHLHLHVDLPRFFTTELSKVQTPDSCQGRVVMLVKKKRSHHGDVSLFENSVPLNPLEYYNVPYSNSHEWGY